MTSGVILAIDQGTTSSRAMLIDAAGRILAEGSRPLDIGSPQPGWVEQDAEALWASVVGSVQQALDRSPTSTIVGIAISNQRESVVGWDARSHQPVAPAISWQDQRGEARCAKLAEDGHGPRVRDVTGLDLGSMYSASKIAWFFDHFGANPDLLVGTVDSWLLFKLTGGLAYATEAGNASRTLLFDVERQQWSPEMGQLFGVDVARLPEVRPSNGPWGSTLNMPGLPDGIPVVAILGDSHAALYGHWALAPDHRQVGKATYGTGSSVMLPVDQPRVRVEGVGTTLAWQTPEPLWALEGNILYSGAGMDWVARTLGVEPGAPLSDLARRAEDSGSAVFVPALNGLGAPWWTASAVGTMTGLSSATTREQIARASLDAVAHQICDVIDVMDPSGSLTALHAGGGATRSELLMQVQADLLGRPLLVSATAEISALGVAALGFATAGIPFHPSADLQPRVVAPTPGSEETRAQRRASWADALQRAGVTR